MDNWRYPFEDHGDPSVDERWRRALTREDALGDMENAGFPLSGVSERVQTPIDRALAPMLMSVDELLADIAGRGA